jgi:hypothetical protein
MRRSESLFGVILRPLNGEKETIPPYCGCRH